MAAKGNWDLKLKPIDSSQKVVHVMDWGLGVFVVSHAIVVDPLSEIPMKDIACGPHSSFAITGIRSLITRLILSLSSHFVRRWTVVCLGMRSVFPAWERQRRKHSRARSCDWRVGRKEGSWGRKQIGWTVIVIVRSRIDSNSKLYWLISLSHSVGEENSEWLAQFCCDHWRRWGLCLGVQLKWFSSRFFDGLFESFTFLIFSARTRMAHSVFPLKLASFHFRPNWSWHIWSAVRGSVTWKWAGITR